MPCFNAFIIYEDFSTNHQAESVIDLLKAHLSGLEVRRNIWKFEMFSSSPMRALATEEALESQMIVVALHQDHTLPRIVQQWLEDLFERMAGSQQEERALVVLLEGTLAEEPQTVTYLRELAKKSGFAFFTRTTESLAEV